MLRVATIHRLLHGHSIHLSWWHQDEHNTKSVNRALGSNDIISWCVGILYLRARPDSFSRMCVLGILILISRKLDVTQARPAEFKRNSYSCVYSENPTSKPEIFAGWREIQKPCQPWKIWGVSTLNLWFLRPKQKPKPFDDPAKPSFSVDPSGLKKPPNQMSMWKSSSRIAVWTGSNIPSQTVVGHSENARYENWAIEETNRTITISDSC